MIQNSTTFQFFILYLLLGFDDAAADPAAASRITLALVCAITGHFIWECHLLFILIFKRTVLFVCLSSKIGSPYTTPTVLELNL